MSPAGVGVLALTPAGHEQAAADAGFLVEQSWTPVPAGGEVGRIVATWTGEQPFEGALRLTVDVDGASDPWWLIPGAFYGENRPADNDRAFPRFEVGASSAADAARLVSDAWAFRADRAATPAVLLWPAPGAGGVALAAAETSPLGLTGIGFDHDAATGSARIHLTFPFREHPVTYYGDAVARPPQHETHRFAPGERVELTVRRFRLTEERYDFARVLRILHQESAPGAPLQPWVPVAAAADLAAEGLLRWHYDPDPGVLLETVGFDREVSGQDGRVVDRQAMHVGWVSGVPWAYALLRHGMRVGDAGEIAAARSVLDFIAANRSPSGTFWGTWYRDRGWSTSWSPLPRGVHARTLGEATLFLQRALRLGDAPPLWQEAVDANLAVIVARQREDGNLGSVHHADTGEVLSWEGAAGLLWIAALVEGADRDPRRLPAAIRAGEHYAKYVDAAFICGAPEDVDRAPTSEDGYTAVIAYTALGRATGEARWWALARRAADWTFSFRYAYNVAFPRETLLGRYDFRSRGADQASPSNQHLHAYGLICTAELVELARATGDPYIRERAEETLACFRQFVAREDGDFNAYRGMVSERFYQTACFQPKGMLLTLSHAWSVGVLLLACEQALELGLAPAAE